MGLAFFWGSTQQTLEKIKEKAAKDYLNVKVYSYSPKYTTSFSAN
jgi:hypothetical protein